MATLSANDAPPLKRRRTDEGEPAAVQQGPYTRGEPWLEDGNIVLVAEDTAFRVLKSILSKVSEVFRDMVSIPQPDGAETLEGCPVVRLQDSKKDLECLLAILFDSGNTYVLLNVYVAVL